MALKRLFAQRLFGRSRATNCRVSSPRTPALSKASNKAAAADRSDGGTFRRHLHCQSGAVSSASSFRFFPTGEMLLETIREVDVSRRSAVKILKVSQLELIKSRLREIEEDRISYSEFMEICSEECADEDQAVELGKMLDESGSVIVLGNIVYIRPEQVVKAMQTLIPASHQNPNNDPRTTQELQHLERQKAAIDTKAKSSVRFEFWCGLCCFAVQTAAFMRLTFWELSWDVMEPVCFFVASLQFMGSYAFFLRTLKELSFEGLFKTRFSAKQRRLIRVRKFDIQRYHELKKASPAVQ